MTPRRAHSSVARTNGGGESLILNVGAGAVTAYGATGAMKVDYVRVWQ